MCARVSSGHELMLHAGQHRASVELVSPHSPLPAKGAQCSAGPRPCVASAGQRVTELTADRGGRVELT